MVFGINKNNYYMARIILPCQKARLTHGYDEIRNVNGKERIHGGYDIVTSDPNLLVLAICDCQIYQAGWSDTFGNRIWVKPLDKELEKKYPFIVYAHLEKITKRAGYIRMGEIIGIMGNTGMSKGVHLHLEARTLPTTEGKPIRIIELEELFKNQNI